MSRNEPVTKVCRECGAVVQVDHARAVCPKCDERALEAKQ